jgi:hypothetical protein
LWLETPSYDPVAARALEVATQRVTLTLPRSFRTRGVTTFDNDGRARVRTLSTTTAQLAIGDNLSIVDIARK